MNLEQWAQEFGQSVSSNCEASERFPEDVFTEEALNIIMAIGEAEDFHLCSYKARGMKVNAYNISSDGDCVDLFVTHRTEDSPPGRITNSEVEKHFEWLRVFLAKCIQTNLRLKFEESAPEWEAAHDIWGRTEIHDRYFGPSVRVEKDWYGNVTKVDRSWF